MTDYMKEAFETWFKRQIWGNEDFKTCLSEAWQAALLAHLQREAVQAVGSEGSALVARAVKLERAGTYGLGSNGKVCVYPQPGRLGVCCESEDRGWNGGCRSCGDPCL